VCSKKKNNSLEIHWISTERIGLMHTPGGKKGNRSRQTGGGGKKTTSCLGDSSGKGECVGVVAGHVRWVNVE